MLRQSGRFAAVGLEMGIAIGLGLVIGKYLDDYFGTTPVLFWVGLGLGFGAAAKAVYDAVKRARKAMEEDEPPTADKD
jgi:ATP synthase protein I